MRRRHYLGVVATAAIAGCLDDEPDTDQPPDDENTDTETPEVESELEPESDADTEVTESEQFAQQRIDEGDALLGEALAVYATDNGVDSFLDVRASVTEFRWVPVARRISAANEAFDRAHRRATSDQRGRIEALRRVGTMIRESARTQESLGVTFDTVGDVLVAHQGDIVSPVAWRRLQERYDVLTGRLDSVREAGSAADTEASGQLSVTEYEDKLEQLEAETNAFQRLLDSRQPFVNGHDAWIRAESAYRRRSWSSAKNRFGETVTAFNQAADQLGEESVGDSRFDTRYRTFRRIAESLAEAAAEYQESAAAYDRRDSETGDDRRRAGRRILRNEDAIDGMQSVRRLETFEP